jgi:mRNA-degrading endonuclease RelE of RelBE toxin-antitoxin system
LACIVDDKLSADFHRQKKELRKKYRHIESDVTRAFEEIIPNYQVGCNAVPIPGYERKVWKYRFKNSDNNRGQSSGYRVLAYFLESANTLYPISIYTHEQYPAQPPADAVDRWIREVLVQVASRPPGR